MESDNTTQITEEVIRLMDLQVEVLKGTLAEMTVSQVHEYAEKATNEKGTSMSSYRSTIEQTSIVT